MKPQRRKYDVDKDFDGNKEFLLMLAIGKFYGITFSELTNLPMPTYLFIREEYINELERQPKK